MNNSKLNLRTSSLTFLVIAGLMMIALAVFLLVPTGNEALAQTDYPALGPLDPPPIPPDNLMTDARVELGYLLFFDPRMSADATISCASCHNPNLGWGNGIPISFGFTNSMHWRNSSTILNSAYFTHLNWSGNAKSLENQASGAWGGAVAGNLDKLLAEERLALMPEYVALFQEAYGREPLWDYALRAVGAFQRTIVSNPENVAFDRYIMGDEDALNEQELRGYELFTGDAACIACHNGPLVSDQEFYNTGVPQPAAWANSPIQQISFRYEQWAKGATEDLYFGAITDLGLFYTTREVEHIGFFRTPSLREIRYTDPYMHNGVFTTIEEVVQFYNAGGGDDPNQDSRLVPLNLSDNDVAAMVAFLLTLSSDEPLLVNPPESLPAYVIDDN